VGKTTLINAILRILAAKRACEILALRPTGRAASGMGETTGLEGQNHPPLLEFDPAGLGFKRNAKLLGWQSRSAGRVDETSMVDVPLMASPAGRPPIQAALLLVGDVDQAALGGWPGQVLPI